MDIELVTEGLRFPEGPIAMADGSVILTEIEGQVLTRVRPAARVAHKTASRAAKARRKTSSMRTSRKSRINRV